MKYFTKYLLDPKGGEIKEGDMVMVDLEHDTTKISRITKRENHPIAGDVVYVEAFGGGYIKNIHYPNTTYGVNKVKLFLCSRDIQVGDAVFCTLQPERSTFMYENQYAKEWCAKVIGEISPDATWVKEGMEFELVDLSFTYKPHDSIERGIVQIKCPNCGYFH